MNDFYKNKKILITGHTGFKGAWLSQVLLSWGADVVGISLEPSTNPNLFSILGLEKAMKNYYLDIRDIDGMRKVIEQEKPEIVFHLAAQPIVKIGYDEPLATFSTNVMGTSNILQIVNDVGFVKSVVIITTDKVYKDTGCEVPYHENDSLGGHDPYSASKAAADIVTLSYIQSFSSPKDFKVKHNMLVAIARSGNVIGGGDWAPYRLVPDIIRSVYEKSEPIEIRYPNAIRPWEHVLEPLSGYLHLGKEMYQEDHSLCGAWNFGPNSESFVSVEDLSKKALSILGRGEIVINDVDAHHETAILKLDIKKAKEILGWKPTLNFEQNLDYTFSWYKNYYENNEDVVEFTNKQIISFFESV